MKRILVIEDDPVSRALVSDALVSDGYDVTSVDSGEAGLTAIQAAPPDLVVMDITLPGIDGLEVARRLKAEDTTARIPLFAVTAEAMDGDEARILSAGCDAYLAKPLQFAVFTSMVERLLAHGGDR